MALNSQPTSGNATPQAPASSDGKTAEFKAAKAAAAKKHTEKVKAAREHDHKMALSARDELQKSGKFDSLNEDVKKWLLAKCVPPSERAVASGPSFLNQVFGETPTVGQKITLQEVINKTFKGLDSMRQLIKKAEGKGITIETAVNQQNMLQTVYTITKIAG